MHELPVIALMSAISVGVHASAQDIENELTTAKRALNLAAQGQTEILKTKARFAKDPIERLFAAYLLYRVSPSANAGLLISAFPSNRKNTSRFIALNHTIPYSPQEEGAEFKHPKVKWAIGFWPIYHAFLEQVKTGDSVALKKFLLLRGHGDGEVGEGIASDIGELFHEPAFVISHWGLLEPHKDFLRSVQNWVTAEEFKKIRQSYEQHLQPGDSRRAIILNLLDHPE